MTKRTPRGEQTDRLLAGAEKGASTEVKRSGIPQNHGHQTAEFQLEAVETRKWKKRVNTDDQSILTRGGVTPKGPSGIAREKRQGVPLKQSKILPKSSQTTNNL